MFRLGRVVTEESVIAVAPSDVLAGLQGCRAHTLVLGISERCDDMGNHEST
jgi:hypothetical protein